MSAHTATRRPPPWRDVRILRIAFQLAFLALVAAFLFFLYMNLVANLRRLGITLSFDFLDRPAGFAIADSDFRSSQAVRRALRVALGNTVRVASLGIVLATVLGVLVGVARLSSNWIVRRAAAIFVESLRNVPVLAIIFFWYFAVLLRLPPIGTAHEWLGLVVLSSRGVVMPGPEQTGPLGLFLVVLLAGAAAALAVAVWRTRRFDRTGEPHRRVLWALGVLLVASVGGYLVTGRPFEITTPERGDLATAGGFRLSPEFAALLVALVLYTASHIAEIVRGSILSVSRGQTEAAYAVGLSEFQRMRYVILPQAFRISVPPLANQYLNLTKNSALGAAIAFPELTRVTQIAISQGNPAPQLIAVAMGIYLFLSLVIALFTNIVNRRLQRAHR
jgi:general L-amino acid transport system permease protein